MRTMCHPLCRPSWLAMYGLDTATSADRAAFLTRVDRWFSRR
jgi:hypothetical protein